MMTTESSPGSIPNFAAWGRAGQLFVSDYAKGTIWRVPDGGGRAKAWFSDPRLESEEFGGKGKGKGKGKASEGGENSCPR